MDIDRVLASNEALGCAFAVVLLLLSRANRIFLRDALHDPDRFWRGVIRLAAAAVVVLIAWTSLFDNWRQLIGVPYRVTQRFASERVEINPPSAEVRTVTVVLLGLTLILVAALLARHVGGYLLQVVLLLGALVLFAPMFAIRQRLNVNLAFGFDGSWTSPLDVLGYMLFVTLAWLFEIALILVAFAVLVTLTALPVTVVLDILRLRRPRATQEAADFYSSFSQRAGAQSHPRTPSI
jgi:hypothetical protein